MPDNNEKYQKIRKTYRDFIGGAKEAGDLKTSILWFAFKRTFFMGDTDQKTYDLLKTLNRVLEHKQHVDVFNQFFRDKVGETYVDKDKNEKITKEDLNQFQSYLLWVFDDLNNRRENLLIEVQNDKTAGNLRAAREKSNQAKELDKILKDFKKYNNRWARRYELKERISNRSIIVDEDKQKQKNSYIIENYDPKSEDEEKRKVEKERRKKRSFKKGSKPIAMTISGLVAAGCAFLVFSGLVFTLGIPVVPAVLLALATFVVNVYVFHPDTVSLFKFSKITDVLKAFVLGTDYAKGNLKHKTKGQIAQTALIAVSSMGMGLGFGLATAAAVIFSLAVFPFFPPVLPIVIGAILGLVTFISFNGVMNAALRKHIEKLKNFSIAKKWGNLRKEWNEINNMDKNDPEKYREKLNAKIHFVVDTIVKFIAWPLLITVSVIGIIATLGALHQSIAPLFAKLPAVSAGIARIASLAVVALVVIPETVFNFTTVRNMFNMVFGLVADVIAAPFQGIALLFNNKTKSSKEADGYFREKSHGVRAFIERFRTDPWKTVGPIWEGLKTAGLFAACGVNAYNNAAFTSGGATTLNNVVHMPTGVAAAGAQYTGFLASAGAGTSASKAAIDQDPLTKVPLSEQPKAEAANDDIHDDEKDVLIVSGNQYAFFSKEPHKAQVEATGNKYTPVDFKKLAEEAAVERQNRHNG